MGRRLPSHITRLNGALLGLTLLFVPATAASGVDLFTRPQEAQ